MCHVDVNHELRLEQRTVMQVHVTVWGLTTMAARSLFALRAGVGGAAAVAELFFLGCGKVTRLKVGRDKHCVPWGLALAVSLSQETGPPVTPKATLLVPRAEMGPGLICDGSAGGAPPGVLNPGSVGGGRARLPHACYSHRRPDGRATALVSWIGSAVEVDRQESVLPALLLCVSVSEALQNMVVAVECNTGFQSLFGAHGVL
eukprot:jgi/Mesen1/10020/ME000727S09335